MIVVSDSTPLITLMKATQLNVIHKLFGEVIIPEAVYHELTTNENYPNEVAIISESPFIKVVTVADEKSVSILQRATGLDLGESEAIVYADDNNVDLLLMDEASGRRVAIGMGLEIMGSIGILVAAFKEGYLPENEADAAFDRIKKSNRHISEKLIEDALNVIHGR